MIKLRITGEAVTDLLTPDLMTPGSKLVEGLPKDVTLVGVGYDNNEGIVEYIFDDGKEEESVAKIKYIAEI